ncbi:hypothetical protein ATCC90586_002224 [Pythium insidiosum]|nr:hypothetical protein ATCC90586_002224 [Pythium insidiosum]
MTGQPSPKRQRTGDKPAAEPLDDAKIQSIFEEVNKVDEDIEKENEKMARELLAIESKYNIAKRPFFEKRGKLLRGIPGFWKQALSNHPFISEIISEHDEKVLESLTEMDVTFVDESGGFKIALHFAENPFIGKVTLWKQITYNEEGELNVTASELKWKSTEEAKEAKEASTFLAWFANTDEDQDTAEMMKDELWKNPVQFYQEDDDEDDEGEDGEDDEDEEDDE